MIYYELIEDGITVDVKGFKHKPKSVYEFDVTILVHKKYEIRKCKLI